MRRRTVGAALLALLGLGLGAAALLLWRDRPGLRGEYFAYTSLEGPPVFSERAAPRLPEPARLERIFFSREVFRVRWQGWIRVEPPGPRHLTVAASPRAALSVDGLPAGARIGPNGTTSLRSALRSGLQPIVIELFQETGSEARLEVAWASADAEPELLPAAALFDRRPGALGLMVRRLTGPLSDLARRLLAGLLLLGSTLLLRAAVLPHLDRLRPGWQALARPFAEVRRRRGAQLALLAALAAAVGLGSTAFTGSPHGGDDIRYMDAALFSKGIGWIVNRYVHVYTLKAFIWLRGGDPFLGSETWWSVMLAGTVFSLGVAVRSLGPGLQARTLAVALFLLAGQVTLFGRIGSAYPDYSAMLFVTAAVAVYLHGLRSEGSSRGEWHAMAVGALTLAAFRSKETGIIAAWILLCYLWEGDRLDLRRFGRRLLWWSGGAALTLVLLIALDGLVLGDLWFSLRPENLRAANDLNFAEIPQTARTGFGWLQLVWSGIPRRDPVFYGLRYLAILVVLAAFAAVGRRVSPAIRLLHLMPLAYLGLLIAVHIRATYVFLPRYLFPILPVSCLLGAMFLRYCGLEEPPWRRILAPRSVIPLALAGFAVALIAVPFQVGDLPAAEFVPAAALSRIGWTDPAAFVRTTLAPGAALLTLAAGALLWRSRPWRLAFLTLALALLFGAGVCWTWWGLATGYSRQRSASILYPWSAFESELEIGRNTSIAVSPALLSRHQMLGPRPTCQRIARLYFRQRRVRLRIGRRLGPRLDYALATREDFELWRSERPELAGAAIWEPTGQVVLVELRRR